MAGFPFILQLLFELRAGAAGGACGQAALKPVAIAEKMDNSRVSLFSYEATRVAFRLPYLGLTLRLGNGLVTKGPGGTALLQPGQHETEQLNRSVVSQKKAGPGTRFPSSPTQVVTGEGIASPKRR